MIDKAAMIKSPVHVNIIHIIMNFLYTAPISQTIYYLYSSPRKAQNIT